MTRGQNPPDIHKIAISTAAYPGRLALIDNPPQALYARGNIQALTASTATVAVVGSRRAGIDSCQAATLLAKTVTLGGGCVVSGLAFGIDAAAHRGALEGGGALPTIAVLGHGLSHCYPRSHRALMDQILAAGGVIVSEYPPETTPLPAYFLARNRIIAGLSEGVVVVQAASRSGSLATARFALDAGREVLVVPGTMGDPRFAGSHRLIQMGASLIHDAGDLFDIFPSLTRADTSKPAVAPEFQPLISRLKQTGEVALSELLEVEPNLLATISCMEMEGLIVRCPGGILRLSARLR